MKPFLALGDSYTIGEGVEATERWPERLAAALQQESIALQAPRVIATTGWTTGELLQAIALQQPLPTDAGLVTLLTGVNNQYRGEALEAFARDNADLLRIAATCAGGDASRVVAISIPDWGRTPFAAKEGRDMEEVSTAIDTFNTAARKAARSAGAAWVDITALGRRHAADPAMHAADGLHPSALQHGLWTGEILTHARAVLRNA